MSAFCIVCLSQSRDLPEIGTTGRAADVMGTGMAVSNGEDEAGTSGGAIVMTGIELATATGVDGDWPVQLLVHETTTPSIVATTIFGACLASMIPVELAKGVLKA